jgi:amidohydrolase
MAPFRIKPAMLWSFSPAWLGRLQTLVSRQVDPLQPAIVAVGSLHEGTAFNIISGQAELRGTVQPLSESVRDLIQAEMQELVPKHASAVGAAATIDHPLGNPSFVNNESLVQLLRPARADNVRETKVASVGSILGGEDIAHYTHVVPGCYAFVAARNPAVGADQPHHHPRFTIDEAVLSIAFRQLLNAVERTSAAGRGLTTELRGAASA